jgi:carbon storage regulator CsrA
MPLGVVPRRLFSFLVVKHGLSFGSAYRHHEMKHVCPQGNKGNPMEKLNSSVAHQIALAGADIGLRRAGVHDRRQRAGVPARPRRARGQLGRKRIGRITTTTGGFAMLVLSRKNRESVVIGGDDGFHRLLKVTVLAIQGANVKLGFDVDPDVSVHRLEVWERIRETVGQTA